MKHYAAVLVLMVAGGAAGAGFMQHNGNVHAAEAMMQQATQAAPKKAAAVNPLLPNMVKVCGDGCTIDAISNQDAVLQYGTGSTWTGAVPRLALPATLPTASLAAVDPAPGVAKELQAQSTSSPYTVKFTPAAGQPAQTVTIPAVCSVNPSPDANPMLPPTPTLCRQLPGMTAVCADGCTLSDASLTGPVLLQYCASAAKCTPAFLFVGLPLPVTPGTAKLGGDPDPAAATRTLYAISTGLYPSTVTYLDAAKASHTGNVPAAPAPLQARR